MARKHKTLMYVALGAAAWWYFQKKKGNNFFGQPILAPVAVGAPLIGSPAQTVAAATTIPTA